MQDFVIEAQKGRAFRLREGDLVSVIDVDGRQVADFFAFNAGDAGEFLSTGATIDANGSVKIRKGDIIYTNRYRPMFEVIDDDVQEHDLIYPSCNQQMYRFLYGSESGHPNCQDNLNDSLAEFGFPRLGIIHPFNIFMRTAILPDGRITVEEPVSGPGDRIRLRTLMDVAVGIAACSAGESKCNGGACTALRVTVEPGGETR